VKGSSALAVLIVAGAALGAQEDSPPPVALASRVLPDTSRSLLVLVQPPSTAVDELRVELPGGMARTAVLLSGPAGWTLARDGSAVRLAGVAIGESFRLRIVLFDVTDLPPVRVRLRSRGREVLNQRLSVDRLPPLETPGPPAGRLAFPTVLMPGEEIEATVLDAARTPEDGQWLIAGVPAAVPAAGRLRVRLPRDLAPGSPLRITYFDVWGERLVEALAADDTVITETAPVEAPRITGCARYGFVGESICVCGSFPQSAWQGLRIDGKPAAIVAASRHVVQVGLSSIAPGAHTITGDPAVGFPASDAVSMIALRLVGSLDSAALLRGQSTTMRLGVEGTVDPTLLTVTNRTPRVVSIPGGNRQDVQTSGGTPNTVERRVDATGKGSFAIDYRLDGPPCPCQEQARGEVASAAARPAPLFVPRRVLATIAVAAPAAMLATAQAVALAHGLAVVEVIPLPAAATGLVVAEITDLAGVVAKAAEVAADARVTSAQPDYVHDTLQASAAPSGPAYGVPMIGADTVQAVSRGEGVRVGIVDAGIDTGHQRLEKKVADYLDVTGTGWTPDAHGTLVAGIIASEPTEAGGHGGVAPGARIVAIKSCVPLSSRHAAARCWSSTLARGIDAAVQRQVHVLNLSVGGPEDRLLSRMVDAAVKRGVVVVSAAGNDGPAGKPSYPAAMESVVAVTAVDPTGRLYPQATRGDFVDVAAPGVDVLSTGPAGRDQLFTGTSAATAFTSGALALLLQASSVSAGDLRTVLRATARDLGAAGRDAEFGDGLIDVCRAVARATGLRLPCR
jgi:hypothetical protein